MGVWGYGCDAVSRDSHSWDSHSWEQVQVEPSPVSRRWGKCIVQLLRAPPIQSATEACQVGGSGRGHATDCATGGPANRVPGPARSEDNGSSNASAAGAPLGPRHHSRRPGNSESPEDWGNELPGRRDPELTTLQPATSRTARVQSTSSDSPRTGP